MGSATRLATYGEDIRLVDVRAKSDRIPVVGSAAGWVWTTQQLRALAMARASGFPADINEKGLSGARRVVAMDLDNLLAVGEAASGIEGFTNLTGVNTSTAGGAITGAWTGGVTTPVQIVADVVVGINLIKATRVWSPNVFLLPTTITAYLRSTLMTPGGSLSIMEWLKKQLPELMIDEWDVLDTAGAGGITRAILYQRDPDVIEGYIPVDIEALPPWQSGPMSYLNVFHARCGGCATADARGIEYLDGV